MPVNQSAVGVAANRSRKKIPVVITLPISTMKITGLRNCSADRASERGADRREDDVAGEDAGGRPGHRRHLVESEVELEDVDPGSPKKPSQRPSVFCVDQLRDTLRRETADRCDAAAWRSGVGRGDVRVDAGARGGDRVDGYVAGAARGCTGRSSFRRLRVARGPPSRGRGWSGRGSRTWSPRRCTRGRGRRPRVEVLRPREGLCGQLRADDLAVPLDQAAVCLVGEGELGEPGEEHRVDEPEHEGQHDHRDRPSARAKRITESASTIGPSVSAGKIIRPAVG